MRPKGKLFALVVLFAAVGLLTATGAFTTVEADRTADVNVSGDSSALLALEPANNSEFATTSNGEVQITLNNSGTGAVSSAEGVNTNATTIDDNVLNITNNGANDVYVNVTASESNGDVVFYNSSNTGTIGTNGGTFTIDNLGNYPDSAAITGSDRVALNSTEVLLGTGETLTIGIYIDTHGLTNSEDVFNDDTVTITANSDESTN
jgi:hypothetical protein